MLCPPQAATPLPTMIINDPPAAGRGHRVPTRQIEVPVLGTRNPASNGNAVDVGGFLTIR
ncbi:hypothetical protein Pme01_61080 [Planosporangium mesophilum]|uniref:Uncharacterized protein n=1 Tax=Planosporangium mesophilum TaxID=689768 RepID=A0A8J3X3Y6_9ACTN|nr:hypothetical protein [Planosporangium mesophilum]GII26511.1 hypothetical protein Pme01_61080 [Planosporangium mesophilum]